MTAFEAPGAFYLGKEYDAEQSELRDDLLLYESKDLTTHAVCVGMTGSGKTGLCISLLEEAAIDGIPAILIDPKGDLANLLLAFPGLSEQEFRPWVDESAAANKGMSPDEYAAATAKKWKEGLASWGQDGARIQRFKDAADVTIYTPGSSAGVSVNILRSFDPPDAKVRASKDLYRERISGTASGLLALLGIEADPVQSKEHVLLSNLFEHAWEHHQGLDLAGLIRLIQAPPFEQVGALDLETYYPSRERMKLAHGLNNLLAAPGFETWLEGSPLSIPSMLHTPAGKPRLSIFSIAHLSDSERMFFVTLLLNEVVAWVRTQPGTSTLRALLYMDEVFGFFPPSAKPPAKTPMLTLLKQARAHGLGVVLATQNPVDLDYKGLSNAGTWFLGRLQTERDKERVLEGLESAAGSAGGALDRASMDKMLSGLPGRVFLMNNVHDKKPAVFHTRWAMSYLAGPATRAQIEQLMREKKVAADGAAAADAPVAGTETAPAPAAANAPAAPPKKKRAPRAVDRPALPAEVDERFVPSLGPAEDEGGVLYRPHLYASSKLHFVRVSAKVDEWENVALLTPLADGKLRSPWSEAQGVHPEDVELESDPESPSRFTKLPAAAMREKSYAGWARSLKQHLYRSNTKTLWKSKKPKAVSELSESERDFRVRLSQMVREEREVQLEKLRTKYRKRLETLQDRVQRAELKVEREQSQYDQQKTQTLISVGATMLGALFGRKSLSASTVGRATTATRGAGRAMRERGDIERAREQLATQKEKMAALEEQFEKDAAKLEEAVDPTALALDEIPVRPRKADIEVERVSLVWIPEGTRVPTSDDPL